MEILPVQNRENTAQGLCLLHFKLLNVGAGKKKKRTNMINFATRSRKKMEVIDYSKEKSMEPIPGYPSNAVGSSAANCAHKVTPFWWIEGLLLSFRSFKTCCSKGHSLLNQWFVKIIHQHTQWFKSYGI